MSEIEETIESPEALRRKAQAEGLDESDVFRFGRPPSLPKWSQAPASRVSATGASSDPSTPAVRVDVIDLRNKGARTRFIDMPQPIYADDANYIAPLRMAISKELNPDRFPPFKHIEMLPMMAYRGNRAVGRLTVQIDRLYNEYHETKAGWFGYFECVDDPAVAHAMLDKGLAWLKEKGMVEVYGPGNPTMNYQSGLLVENFDRPPVVETLYNPPYYEALLTSYGFGKAKDLFCWWIDVANGMDTPKRKRIHRISERIKKREGISIRHASIKNADREIERIHELFMACWQKNWGFSPIPKAEFMELAQDLKQIIIEELIIFIIIDDRPVAFSLTVPNVNEKMPRDGRLFPFGWTKLAFGLKKTQFARLYLLGTLPEYRKRGLESILISETVLQANKKGISGGEVGWTLEDNDLINRAIESMEGHIDRRYRILGLDLTD